MNLTRAEIEWVRGQRNDLIAENRVIVSYVVEASEGLTPDQIGALFAYTVSVGSRKPLKHVKDDIAPEMVAKFFRQDSESVGSGPFQISIGYPSGLVSPHEGITQLISVFSFMSEYSWARSIWVEDIEFPPAWGVETNFGPRFGVTGLREKTEVTERPLVGLILKPRLGLTRSAAEHIAKEAFLGGIDFVVDDELVVDPLGELEFTSRVELLSSVAQSSSETTGEKKSFFANITSDPRKSFDLARKARKLGATGLSLNGFSMGYGAISDLKSDSDIDLPIISTNIGVSLLTRPSPGHNPRSGSGISETVIAKLSRVAGADAVHTGAAASTWHQWEGPSWSRIALQHGSQSYRRSMPVIAGGINVANIWPNFVMFGQDMMIEAGKGILTYPGGIREGAKAFRMIVEALDVDMSEEEASDSIWRLTKAKELPNLERALAISRWNEGKENKL